MIRKTRLDRRILALLVASLGLLLPYSAYAALTVTSCTLSTPAGMVFNTTLLSGLQSTTSVTLNCSTTGAGNATVTINLSAGSSASVAQRNLKQNSTDVLTYNLYQDSGYVNLWGNTAANQFSQKITANVVNQVITIYGKIDSTTANQSQPVGTYSDPIITASVNW